MKISGSGTLSEGKINDEIQISGSAKIKGNFECNGFHSSGSTRGTGNLTVYGDIVNSGSFRLIGNLYGDGNLRSSGSMSVDGEVLIKGKLHSSGSFRAGMKVEAIDGFKSSGSARVQGELLTLESVIISGSSTIYGNVSGTDVIIGRRGFGINIYKHPNKVVGTILARNNIELMKLLVDGDVKGRDVIIGRNTEVLGTVYYVNRIDVQDKTILANKPIQIKEEDLHF